MNTRRNFLRSILVAGASFTILPGAGRIWRAHHTETIGGIYVDLIAEGGEIFELMTIPIPLVAAYCDIRGLRRK